MSLCIKSLIKNMNLVIGCTIGTIVMQEITASGFT